MSELARKLTVELLAARIEAQVALDRIGHALLAHRKILGQSVAGASAASGIEHSAFSYIERGLRLPTDEQMVLIIDYITEYP